LALLAISKITDSGEIKVNESLDEVAANATEADATSADDNIKISIQYIVFVEYYIILFGFPC
jgi:hypothetical protein